MLSIKSFQDRIKIETRAGRHKWNNIFIFNYFGNVYSTKFFISSLSQSRLDVNIESMHGDESEGSLGGNEPANCDQQYGYSCPRMLPSTKLVCKRKISWQNLVFIHDKKHSQESLRENISQHNKVRSSPTHN